MSLSSSLRTSSGIAFTSMADKNKDNLLTTSAHSPGKTCLVFSPDGACVLLLVMCLVSCVEIIRKISELSIREAATLLCASGRLQEVLILSPIPLWTRMRA